MPLIGRIIEWSPERGFGYLEHDGRRVFLHYREFKKRHKPLKIGDVVHFSLGTNRQGRTCATGAILASDVVSSSAGGRLRLWHLLLVATFLIFPGVAVYQISGRIGLIYIGVWVGIISVVTFLIYGWDKRQARIQGQREPEGHLHLLEVLGG